MKVKLTTQSSNSDNNILQLCQLGHHMTHQIHKGHLIAKRYFPVVGSTKTAWITKNRLNP